MTAPRLDRLTYILDGETWHVLTLANGYLILIQPDGRSRCLRTARLREVEPGHLRYLGEPG